MKQILLNILKMAIYWLLFFAFMRLVFIIFYWGKIRASGAGAGDILGAFVHGLPLDISTLCYIMIIPCLIWAVNAFINSPVFKVIHIVYAGILLLTFGFILGGELGIYDEWQTKLSYKALVYLKNPSEVVNSASTGSVILLLFLVLFTAAAWLHVFHRLFYKDIIIKKRNYWAAGAYTLVFPVILFLGLRGGIQPIPISIADSYYSKHQILNDVAVNSVYNLGINCWKSSLTMDNKQFTFYSDQEALQVVDSLHHIEKDTTIHVLTTQKPNIVIILLESWSGDMIASLGGDEGITPQFAQLEKEGLLFTQFYANGNRSQEGIAAVFSASPPILHSTITSFPDKYNSLSYFPIDLKKQGYQTEFIFGGDLNYGNLLSYIYHNQFDKIVTEKDFDKKIKRGKLGVPDEHGFSRTIQELNKMKQPFFTTMFTLSSHSPYDQPMEKVLNWNVPQIEYINSVYYTDKCLGDFIKEAQKQSWFDNTLFILMADHSHPSQKDRDILTDEYHHIPMLWYGNVLKQEYKGAKYDQLAAHVDLAATILEQLNLSSKKFKWSKNLMNPYSKHFVYIAEHDHFGWKNVDGYFCFNVLTDKYSINNLPDSKKEQAIKDGKSYMQVLYQEFMKY